MESPDYICPSCGVLVCADIALSEDPVTGELLCVICAPYDEEREDIAILFLDDAQEQLFRRHGHRMGAADPSKPERPANIVFDRDEAQEAKDFNDFLKELFRVLYDEAKPGSTNYRTRDVALELLDDINVLIEAKLVEAKVRQLIIPKDVSANYYYILDLLHTRYVNAHRKYLERQADEEEARRKSYHHFWHLGSLVRSGRLAAKESPWVTGEKPPRF